MTVSSRSVQIPRLQGRHETSSGPYSSRARAAHTKDSALSFVVQKLPASIYEHARGVPAENSAIMSATNGFRTRCLTYVRHSYFIEYRDLPVSRPSGASACTLLRDARKTPVLKTNVGFLLLALPFSLGARAAKLGRCEKRRGYRKGNDEQNIENAECTLAFNRRVQPLRRATVWCFSCCAVSVSRRHELL